MRPAITRILWAFLLILTNCSAPVSTYYVDALSGNDANSGSLEKPFKTIERVNRLKLQPGNSVYFTGGQTFAGNLHFKGISGTKEKSIKLTSYGSGRATIDAKKRHRPKSG